MRTCVLSPNDEFNWYSRWKLRWRQRLCLAENWKFFLSSVLKTVKESHKVTLCHWLWKTAAQIKLFKPSPLIGLNVKLFSYQMSPEPNDFFTSRSTLSSACVFFLGTLFEKFREGSVRQKRHDENVIIARAKFSKRQRFSGTSQRRRKKKWASNDDATWRKCFNHLLSRDYFSVISVCVEAENTQFKIMFLMWTTVSQTLCLSMCMKGSLDACVTKWIFRGGSWGQKIS